MIAARRQWPKSLRGSSPKNPINLGRGIAAVREQQFERMVAPRQRLRMPWRLREVSLLGSSCSPIGTRHCSPYLRL